MRRWWEVAAYGLGLVALAIALAPESPSVPLTAPGTWQVTGAPGSQVPLAELPWPVGYVRESTLASPGSTVFRNWTPAQGTGPLEVTSSPFVPARYMAVTVTGRTRSALGLSRLQLVCDSNAQALPVLAGNVNTNVTEAIVAPPDGWCPGTARLVFASREPRHLAGAGTVAGIGAVSYLKHTALGRLPFLLVALVVFSAIVWAGAALARRAGWRGPPFAYGFAAFGLVSLIDFYLVSLTPPAVRWLPSVAIAACFVATWVALASRAEATTRALRPSMVLWWTGALATFLFQGLATSGAGHWDPNFRFWPATWSSDHELPWLLAQGLRFDLPLAGLFPPWLPTDRPPLMAGASLLLLEPYRWLQWFNDGEYLRGQAFNASAVALGAMWIPVGWHFLCVAAGHLRVRARLGVLAVVALTPLSLFNTQYGWPKALSGAFTLLAVTCAWRTARDGEDRTHATLFFVLGACAVMSHASAGVLVGPVALALMWRHRRRPALVLPGLVLALLIGGAWGAFRTAVLPSREPLIRYALAGDYGFADPPMSVAAKVRAAYGAVDLPTWVGVKARMLVQPFVRVTHSMSRVDFNMDIGPGVVDGWRGLDIMLLAPGNAAIPLFVLLGGLAAWRGPHVTTSERRLLHAMLFWTVATWLGLALFFLAPPVTPVWPLGILFGAALGGAVLASAAFPRAYRGIALVSVAYSVVVWGLLPLSVALSLDPIAATMLVALCVALVLRRRQVEAALAGSEGH